MTGELFLKKYWQGQTDSVDENSLLGPMTPQEESDILIVTCNQKILMVTLQSSTSNSKGTILYYVFRLKKMKKSRYLYMIFQYHTVYHVTLKIRISF